MRCDKSCCTCWKNDENFWVRGCDLGDPPMPRMAGVVSKRSLTTVSKRLLTTVDAARINCCSSAYQLLLPVTNLVTKV